MKINVNIDKIEFEVVRGQDKKEVRPIEFSFHDQVRIKKEFERTLEKLFLDTKKNDINRTFSIRKMLNNEIFFTLKNFGNINLVKEMDGGEFSLSSGDKDPFQVGKRLAESIYSSLNLMDSNSSNGSSNSMGLAHKKGISIDSENTSK